MSDTVAVGSSNIIVLGLEAHMYLVGGVWKVFLCSFFSCC